MALGRAFEYALLKGWALGAAISISKEPVLSLVLWNVVIESSIDSRVRLVSRVVVGNLPHTSICIGVDGSIEVHTALQIVPNTLVSVPKSEEQIYLSA